MTVEISRRLRRSPTDAEIKLWSHLRNRQLGVKFRRQMPIDRYVADFASEEAKVIVELDGGQHAMDTAADGARTAALEARGYLVVRFWNNDVLSNIEGVVAEIVGVLDARGAGRPGL